MADTVRFSGNAADITLHMTPANISNSGRKDEMPMEPENEEQWNVYYITTFQNLVVQEGTDGEV